MKDGATREKISRLSYMIPQIKSSKYFIIGKAIFGLLATVVGGKKMATVVGGKKINSKTMITLFNNNLQ